MGLLKKQGALPGFGLSFGISLAYMSLLVLIPLFALFLFSAKIDASELKAILTDERVWKAFELSFGTSLLAGAINAVFGFMVAWVIVRYEFFGKKFIDSLIDLPFALPTAVAGIALASIFAPNGILGEYLVPLGIELAFSRGGIVIALVFIGLPFIVRTLQPVMEEMDKSIEEASYTLGASFFQTFFKVILPPLFPALLTGFGLAFARGLGEYGSIIFISSNIPYVSEIVPLLIVTKLTSFDYAGASVVGVLMLIVAFVMLLVLNLIQKRFTKAYR